VIIDSSGRKPHLLAVDVIMIIKHRQQLVAQVARGAKRSRPYVEIAEVAAWICQPAGQLSERDPATADVQRRIEVATDRIELAAREVIIGNFADQEEVPLTEVDRELLDRPAEVPRLLVAHMLDGVDSETVTIGKRDPVHEHPSRKLSAPGESRARSRMSSESVRRNSA
jgi:hypothetical protein